MRSSVVRICCLAFITVLAAAGCRSGGGNSSPPPQQPASAPTAAPAQLTPDNLVSFDVMANGARVGSFRKIGTNLWEGPSSDSGRIVQWSQEDADSLSLVVYTEDPRIRTLIVYGDDTVGSAGLPDNATMSRAAYQ